MLYIIGLGLGDERDITLRGLDAVKKCEKVYIEAYTSLLSFGLSTDGLSTLEELYGKQLILADREMVEEKVDNILAEASGSDVAFLVVGDPFGATTHTDLVVRAKTLGVAVKVVHNASVMNAIGICGLQLYRYGETVSIPFFTETWRPDSFYEKIQRNRNLGLHTLCLLVRKNDHIFCMLEYLGVITAKIAANSSQQMMSSKFSKEQHEDAHCISFRYGSVFLQFSTRDSNNWPFKINTVRGINLWVLVYVLPDSRVLNRFYSFSLADIRVKEPTLESLCRGRKQYEPPRYMTISTAIEQLLEVEQKHGESAYDEDTDCVGFARLGSEDQLIVAGTMRQLRMVDFGKPLHCLVMVGKTHPVEQEMLEFYKIR